MKHIIFTVTNDLNYDQRMIRICTSLIENGYAVSLIGVQKKSSNALEPKKYLQKRIRVWAIKGPLFYIEYNIKLFFYLLFKKADGVCCIDLDTIMPVYIAAILTNKKRIYDAHEYFSQLKEIVSRPKIYKIWHGIEKRFVPKFKNGYTVSKSIALAFKKLYKVEYETIRNIPLKKEIFSNEIKNKNIVYQGAINEGRGFEGLIPAMQQVNAVLEVYGDGNYVEQTKKLITKYNVAHKVILKGKLLPADLKKITEDAYIGINLVENTGLNQYYSLANKFFDYIQNGVPQVTMNFPEYAEINAAHHIAVLIDDIEPSNIANAINTLLSDEVLYANLKNNCAAASLHYNWQSEEKKLLSFYATIFG